MKRLMEYTVRFGLVTACRRAGSPTGTSPLSLNATTLGVSRLPSALGMTFASLPSITATTELVVPKSMPMIFSPTAINRSYHGPQGSSRNGGQLAGQHKLFGL